MNNEQRVPKVSPAQALERLMNYCTRYETCSHKVREKLRYWKIEEAEQENILQQLTTQKFVDDARFAKSFARTKSQYGKWGMQKIKYHLQSLHIGRELIEEALQEINQEEEPKILQELLRKKMKQIKAKSEADLMTKLIRFGMSKGYNYPLVIDVAKQLVKINLD